MGGAYPFLLLVCFTRFLAIIADEHLPHRQAMEITIGGDDGFEIIIGGGGAPPSPLRKTQDYWWWRCSSILGPPPAACPPTPPPLSPKPSPQPLQKPPPASPFEISELVREVFPVIQAFRKKITVDPLHITDTWQGKDVCGKYKGFVCGIAPDKQGKALVGVNFDGYYFSGPNLTISEFLFGLKEIVFFHANSNNFTGTIPDRIGELPYLKELGLSNNLFTGAFPYPLLKAKKLLLLDLSFNRFAGIVPPQVFLLNLDLLFIHNNKFVQKLPDNLGSTTAFSLNLANNKFIGGIPKSIGQASNTLLQVLFLNNQLTGCLPYEIGLLNKTTVFDVGFNFLSGPIPHSFRCLKKMMFLNLAKNKFYGPVPEAVCSLPELFNFTISYNYFTQVGPRCRKLIKDGVLDAKMNCILNLPNQRSAAECAKFFSTTHTCPNEKSLTYVPCSVGLESNESNSSQLESNNVYVPAQAPRAQIYASLLPHTSLDFWKN
uniref:uncharacterized protein At4g06744-like n=1 Tax=Erigeron canadensis TaxID=72917 RepID=UPI001CB993CA|nr:uncharacterized protein At4g06744-like [Erigeron canadensis]